MTGRVYVNLLEGKMWFTFLDHLVFHCPNCDPHDPTSCHATWTDPRLKQIAWAEQQLREFLEPTWYFSLFFYIFLWGIVVSGEQVWQYDNEVINWTRPLWGLTIPQLLLRYANLNICIQVVNSLFLRVTSHVLWMGEVGPFMFRPQRGGCMQRSAHEKWYDGPL